MQPPKGVRPLPQWVQWQGDNAWIEPTCGVTADEHPADTATTVSRVLAVDEEVHGDHGSQQSSGATVWTTATKSANQWSVSRFDVELR